MLEMTESSFVVFGALLLSVGVVFLFTSQNSKFLPYIKTLTQASIKIPGFNVTLKGGGLVVFFLSLFVLIVALYMALRALPGSP